MQNLTNIEINAVAGGLDSPASFFRSAAAQRIHEENHKLHHHRNHHKERNVAADTAIFVFFLGVKVITTVIYTTAMLVTLTYLCIKDTYINNQRKSLHQQSNMAK